MPTQRAECPFCDARRFIRIQSVRLELWLDDSRMRETDFRGELLACLGCGRVELFQDDPARFLERLQREGRAVEVIVV